MKRLTFYVKAMAINFALLSFSFGASAQTSIQWQKCLGGTSDDEAYFIQQTLDGGYIVAGWTSSTDGDVIGNHDSTDYWIVKLDTIGNIQWQKTLGGTDYDEAYSIRQTSDGGYIVAGRSWSNDGDVTDGHGASDYWIVKLDTIGNIQWQKCLGGTGNDEAFSIQQTSNNEYIIAGWAWSNDGDVIGHHDSADYWVVKLIFSPTNIAEDINSPSYIKIYPNPFTDFINIDIGDKTADVKLMNLLGQVVFSESLRQNKNVVSGINIPAGVYILQVQNSKIFSTQMVVKK